jgi:hypothetical protein
MYAVTYNIIQLYAMLLVPWVPSSLGAVTRLSKRLTVLTLEQNGLSKPGNFFYM